ncbi:MAG: hypothetical protein AAFV95_28635 [Bacteroidota bacterium]
MKKIILLCCVMLSFCPAAIAGASYWVETTSLDSFTLIEDGRLRPLKAYNADQTKFVFTTDCPAKKLYIQLHCQSCENALTAKIFDKQKGAYTHWISTSHGGRISIEEAFRLHTENNGLYGLFQKAIDLFHDFRSSFGNGRTARGETPTLRTTKVRPGDPKLEFLRTDRHYYVDSTEFSVSFRMLNEYPINEIYIIAHSGETILQTNQQGISDEAVKKSGKKMPAIADVLQKVDAKEGETTYKIHWELIQEHALTSFQKGEYYQLEIKLQKDTAEYNPYLFDFYFYSEELLQKSLNFFDIDKE